MVLSNAERQARYRRRRKQLTATDALPERARQAADAAVAAMWAFFNRPTDDGRLWGDIEGMADASAFAVDVANQGGLIDRCRSMLRNPEGMLPEEQAALQVLVDVADAIDLAKLRQPAKKSRR